MKKILVFAFILLATFSCTRRVGSGSSRSASSDRSARVEYNTNNSSRRASRGSSRETVTQTTAPQPTHTPSRGKALTPQEIFKRCNPAVFMVFTSSAHQSCQGSGFFISPSGLAVSNYHVFQGTHIGAEVIRLSDGSQYKLDRVLYKDANEDIFIFTITPPAGRQFQYIPVSTKSPQVGDKAYH